MSCIVCCNDPCTCSKGQVRELTVKIDKETWKAIEQEAGGGSIEDQAARILTTHARRDKGGGSDYAYLGQ